MLLIGISVKVPTGAAATAAAAGTASAAGACNQRKTAQFTGLAQHQSQSSSVGRTRAEAMPSLACEQQTFPLSSPTSDPQLGSL